MDALTNRLGTRFLVVTVVPNVLLIGYIGFLIAAGAPAHSPSLAKALKVLDGLTVHQVIALVLGVLVISIASHPLQTPLIQLMEGYWWGLPLGPRLANRAINRIMRERNRTLDEIDKARAQLGEDPQNRDAKNIARRAQFRLDWLPDREADLLPTALGNTLRKGETRAGRPYELQLTVALPRLIPSMSQGIFDEVSDRRNQLDAAVRLCVASGIATAVSVGLLLWDGAWLFLAVAAYLLCWTCYRSAVAAARGFSSSLAAAIDLHHLQLFDALSLERPPDIATECERNRILTKLFNRAPLRKGDKSMLHYIVPKADNSAESGAKALPAPDPGSPAP